MKTSVFRLFVNIHNTTSSSFYSAIVLANRICKQVASTE